ncbi:LPS translocon maturation chaperone LptM [Variovorax sp. PAMC26660]|uniref:LPS translocon maturation chaperone LptM n=1 Tax=Variovorax sp. PAMC26660 TaxID=2762322 RepID=UPI001C9A679C|nr:lipoprotein [Variovorax sp. PAMC26660]
MLNLRQILVSARARTALMVCLVAGAAGLAACGQKGALYQPNDPAAAQRATLPQLLVPGGLLNSTPSTEAAPAPAAASSAPAAATTGNGARK